MIEKTYRCDLCFTQIKEKNVPDKRPAKRIKFGGNKIILAELNDTEASEKMICGNCLNALAAALGVKP